MIICWKRRKWRTGKSRTGICWTNISENAGPENAGPFCRTGKCGTILQDRKMRVNFAGLENAGPLFYLVLLIPVLHFQSTPYVCISSIEQAAGNHEWLLPSAFLHRAKSDLELRQRAKRCLHVLVAVLHNCFGRTYFSTSCDMAAGM